MHTNVEFRTEALVYRALGNERRIWILTYLSKKHRTLREIQQVLGIRHPAVSRHLHLLLRSNLITSRRIGTQVVFGISPGVNVPAILKPQHLVTKSPSALTAVKTVGRGEM